MASRQISVGTSYEDSIHAGTANEKLAFIRDDHDSSKVQNTSQPAEGGSELPKDSRESIVEIQDDEEPEPSSFPNGVSNENT
jgi:hypothetical protein